MDSNRRRRRPQQRKRGLKRWHVIVLAILILIGIGAILGPGDAPQTRVSPESAYVAATEAASVVEAVAPEQQLLQQTVENSVPLGHQNALKSAQSYLSIMSFSQTGLIGQLEFDGYSTEEATYAAEQCGADWNAQAEGKARSYLANMSFSRTGLIGQLEFDGFSTEQATYAVDQCGADWNAQAEAKARSYLEYMAFSRQNLIDQLVFDGFTQEQAEHGVSAVGY